MFKNALFYYFHAEKSSFLDISFFTAKQPLSTCSSGCFQKENQENTSYGIMLED